MSLHEELLECIEIGKNLPETISPIEAFELGTANIKKLLKNYTAKEIKQEMQKIYGE